MLREHLATMARYHAWATQRLLAAVAPLPEDAYRRDAGLFFRSIHGTLNHLLLTDAELWWRRFAEGASPSLRLDQELEPDRARLAQRLQAAAEAWGPALAGWPDARLAGRLDYRRMGGQAVSLPFAPTLLHVFNHGTHHRGQVTAALTAAGHASPELDLVYLLQEAAK